MNIESYGYFAPGGVIAVLISQTRKMPDTWLGKRMSFLLRRLALILLKGKPVDIAAFDAKMRLFPYNNVCEKRILFTPQYFDHAELAILKSRIKPGFHFIDIGANIGGYTLFVAAAAGSGARISTPYL
jgi:hypothetical protein